MPGDDRIRRFGVFEVDLAAGELRRNGVRVKLQDQPFQVLAALLEKPGEVVTKEELQERIWRDDTFVDFDRSLATAVNKVRQALGDSATNSRFVETVPKRGYRFLDAAAGKAAGQIPDGHGGTGEWASKQRLFGMPLIHVATGYDPLTGRVRVAKGVIAIGAIAVGAFAAGGISIGAVAIGGISAGIASLGGIAMALWMSFGAVAVGLAPHGAVAVGPGGAQVTDVARSPSAPPLITPLTAFPGNETSPTFSPDASQIAFAWDGGDRARPTDIYTLVVGTAVPRPLTQTPVDEFAPAWSPDGRWVAFARARSERFLLDRVEGLEPNADLWLIPAGGGSEVRLTELSITDQELTGFAWTPDSSYVLHTASNGGLPDGIAAVHVETHDVRLVTSTSSSGLPAAQIYDSMPALSQEGSLLAFRRGERYNGRFYVTEIADDLQAVGKPREISSTPVLANGSGAAFLGGGRGLLLTLNGQLLRMRPDTSSEPETLSWVTTNIATPAVSLGGDRVALAQRQGESHLWQAQLTDGFHATGDPEQLHHSTKSEGFLQYSWDGERVAFQSNRSGNFEVWLGGVRNQGLRQLTFLGAHSGSPSWSPDGRRIAFDSNESGSWQVYVVGADGGKPDRLTSGFGLAAKPHWSPDGEWIYFGGADADGTDGIWKVRPSGADLAMVFEGQNYFAGVSSDEGWLYYLAEGAIWRVRTSGGTPEQIADQPGQVAVTDHGVFFTRREETDFSVKILFMRLPGGEVIDTGIAVEPNGSDRWVIIAASRDARRLTWVQRARSESDIVLVENFR